MATALKRALVRSTMMSRLVSQSPYALGLQRTRTRFGGLTLMRRGRGDVSSHVRSLATQQQRLTQTDGNEILAAQRLHRPVSPHLSIYRPQITWYGSALNRITGSILSGAFYTYFAAYLVAPLLGWHVGSVTLAAAFGAWPVVVKTALKFALAFPFTYHSLSGVRHLVWDMGMQMRNQQVAFTGWLVVGLSLAGSALLAFL